MKRLVEYLLDPCGGLESSGGTNMSETEELPASYVAPLRNRQRINYEEGSIKGADLCDDLDFSPTKSLTKAQDDSDDEIVGSLHAKHKSSGDFPGTGFIYHDSAQPMGEATKCLKPCSIDHNGSSRPKFYTTKGTQANEILRSPSTLDIYEPRQSSGYNINKNF